jgi:hypothetical protein
VDADVELACRIIQAIAVHEAWFAANTRSLRFGEAARDREEADTAFKALKKVLPFEAANLLRKLAKYSSWHASNKMSLVMIDAWHDERIWQACLDQLRSKFSEDLTDTLESLFWNAAWYAAHIRRLQWRAAASNAHKYNEAVAQLQPSLRTAQMDEREYMRQQMSMEFSNSDSGPSSMGRVHSGFGQPEISLGQKLSGSCTEGIYFVLRRAAKSTSCWNLCYIRQAYQQNVVAPPSPEDTSLGSIGCESVNSAEILADSTVEDSITRAEPASPTVMPTDKPPDLARGMNALSDASVAWQAVAFSEAKEVAVLTFIEAASATAALFDCLGKVVAQVKADVTGNVSKLNKNVSGDASETIEQLMNGELAAVTSPAEAAVEGSSCLALIWLCRMLRLLDRAIAEMVQDSGKALGECLLDGYNSCLAPHHPWLMRKGTTSAIRNFSISRETFLKALGDNLVDVEESLRPFHEGMSHVLQHILRLMVDKGLEQPDL